MEEYALGIHIGMAVALLLVLLFCLILYKKGKLTDSVFVGAILCMGCIMRIGYTLYTGCYVRGHDMWQPAFWAKGKAAYVLTILRNWKLPDGYGVQYYQQPLFYFLGAVSSKIVNTITGDTDAYHLVDGAKWASCVVSICTLFIFHKLCDQYQIKGKAKCYSMAFIAFIPEFYLIGGRVSEEALLLFFMTAALLVTGYWEENPSWKNTILLALIYGFGMMTKISMAVIALYTAFVFYQVVKEKEKDQMGKLMGRIVVFGCISFPLGLWFNIRNYILFGQPIGYVLPQEIGGDLDRSGESLISRFLGLDIKNLLETPFADPFSNKNLPTYLLKGELFGEFQYEIPKAIPVLLLFFSICLNVYVFYLTILLLAKKVGNEKDRALAGIYWLFIAFAAYSYLRYPFGCTMDYRYYVFLSILKGLLLGRSVTYLESEALLIRGISRKRFVRNCLILLSVFSCAMYCYIQ